VEVLVIALFNETKIPIMDMKVQVYSNLAKKIQKNEISKLHEDWKISPSQVYGQASKNGSAVYMFSQNARPILITPKKMFKKLQKKGASPQSVRPLVAGE
jgi:hypothetical protein